MPSITSYVSTVFGARRVQPASHGTILFVMCRGVLIAQLDSSVVNLALQPISRDLHASVSQLQWVVDSYNLIYATLLLTGDMLADLYGRARIFASGIALILVGSLICPLASSTILLIAGRALTGISAGCGSLIWMERWVSSPARCSRSPSFSMTRWSRGWRSRRAPRSQSTGLHAAGTSRYPVPAFSM